MRKRRLDVLQAAEPIGAGIGIETVQYGKVESWEKRKNEYHIILDSGERIFSPILGSCDVHIMGDNEVEGVKGIAVPQHQVATFSCYLIRGFASHLEGAMHPPPSLHE
jgi:hypothetical protein